MKWFKHMSDSLDDPFIQDLVTEFGGNGYMAYFGLIEIICKENGNKLTGKLEINPRYLKQKFHISSRKLEEIFRFCSGKGKLFFNFSEVLWKFEMPNMLNIKDNYTKDLQATGKKLSKQEEAEGEEEEDIRETAKKQVSLNCIKQMTVKYPQYDIEANLENFMNYAPNRKEPYKDYDAGFRLWMGNSIPKVKSKTRELKIIT